MGLMNLSDELNLRIIVTLFSAYYDLGSILNSLYVPAHLILTKTREIGTPVSPFYR